MQIQHLYIQQLVTVLTVKPHLVLCSALILLKQLQQVIMFCIKLSQFLSVELQQLTRRSQISQAL